MQSVKSLKFDTYHPAVTLLYLASALAAAMVTLQPGFMCVSLLCGSACYIYLNGARKYFSMLRWLAVVAAVIIFLNPLFNPKGMTVLFYLGDMPFTLESLLYGVCAGGMLAAVFVWFGCFKRLMTGERFMYLFAGFAPATALMASMILRWIPNISRRMRQVRQARAGMVGEGGRRERVREAARDAGVLMAWSMEDSIQTADSMRARGYGVGRRTTYSRFRFGARDIVAVCVLTSLLVVSLALIIITERDFAFYPTVGGIETNALAYVPYAVMLLMPLILEIPARTRTGDPHV